ncbi:preprotein translocase subunit SecG [Aurantiacibacter xanthus]|uniref:Protein-export membrane protein SecG n=1 Tax=Aurantiacibacter xanthus TaxID=1784712 RepID=A0A3A1PCE3_9SPHN|nr:preprotein translocase subunit SecG [Aurantiacibacter xanthus]RIV90675.1 preprotein translocase subunit SecG [Aurantiacibacter xanthus]
MGLFLFLTVVQAIVAFVLVILVLMQRSEGGGLGMGGGGSPGGVMSARGAADFLTRATKWAAVLFVALAIVLAGVAVDASGTRTIDDSLDRTVSQPAGGATQGVPSAPSAGEAAPAQAPSDDPLAGVSE